MLDIRLNFKRTSLYYEKEHGPMASDWFAVSDCCCAGRSSIVTYVLLTDI